MSGDYTPEERSQIERDRLRGDIEVATTVPIYLEHMFSELILRCKKDHLDETVKELEVVLTNLRNSAGIRTEAEKEIAEALIERAEYWTSHPTKLTLKEFVEYLKKRGTPYSRETVRKTFIRFEVGHLLDPAIEWDDSMNVPFPDDHT